MPNEPPGKPGVSCFREACGRLLKVAKTAGCIEIQAAHGSLGAQPGGTGADPGPGEVGLRCRTLAARARGREARPRARPRASRDLRALPRGRRGDEAEVPS